MPGPGSAAVRLCTLARVSRWRWVVVLGVAVAILAGAGFLVVRFLLGNDATSGPECVVEPDPTLSAQTSTTVALAR